MKTSLRYPVAAIAGLLTALGLLWLMQTLTTGKSTEVVRRDGLPLVTFVHTRQETETRVRERMLPKPPPEPKVLPRPALDIAPDIRPEMPRPQFRMALDIEPAFSGEAYLGLPASSEADREFMPVSRTPPQYPYQATRRRIEGWVRVSFLVTETGSVEDIVLLESEPEGIFDRAAIRAVSKWKFKPRIVDGQPVAARAEQVVEFRLNE
jgi:protein TonB